MTAAATKDEQLEQPEPRAPSAGQTPPTTSQARPRRPSAPSTGHAPPKPPPRPSSAGKTPAGPASAAPLAEDNAVGEIELDSPEPNHDNSPEPELEARYGHHLHLNPLCYTATTPTLCGGRSNTIKVY